MPRTTKAKQLFGIGADNVEFMGYWLLAADNDPEKKDVKVSAWVRKARARRWPQWLTSRHRTGGGPSAAAGRDGVKKDAVACDGEDLSFAGIPLSGGKTGAFGPRHNYRMVLIGAPGVFPRDLPAPGAALEKPKKTIKALCDEFQRQGNWRRIGNWSAPRDGKQYTRLSQPSHGHRRGLPHDGRGAQTGEDNVTVQVRIESMNYMQNSVGLLLQWDNGNCVFSGPSLIR